MEKQEIVLDFTKMPENEREVLSSLDDVPPRSLLQKSTLHQKEEWESVKARYQWLKENLKAYFEGRKAFLNELTDLEREVCFLERDAWLAFYTVIQYAWDDIAAIAEETGFPLETRFKVYTPGQALIRCIEKEAMFDISHAFSQYHRWTPGGERSVYREGQKLEKLRKELDDLYSELGKIKDQSSKSYTSLNSKIERQTERFWKQEEKIRKIIGAITKTTDQYTELQRFCIKACQETCKKKKDRTLKQYIAQLEHVLARRSLFMKRTVLNTRPAFKGYEWQNGVKKPMARYGGKPELNKTSQ